MQFIVWYRFSPSAGPTIIVTLFVPNVVIIIIIIIIMLFCIDLGYGPFVREKGQRALAP